MFDVILKGGEVFDGTGAESTITDVGVSDGKIVEIGDLSKSKAAQMIDASGLTVAPGAADSAPGGTGVPSRTRGPQAASAAPPAAMPSEERICLRFR